MDGRHPSGGSRGLAELIDDYGDVLTGDFQEYYGVDIRDIFDPVKPLTPARFLVLIKTLPEGSRFIAERQGGQEFRGWDAGRYATVSIVNAVRALQWTYVAAHAKSRPKPPEPFPTPGDKKPVRKKDNMFATIAAAKLAEVRKAE